MEGPALPPNFKDRNLDSSSPPPLSPGRSPRKPYRERSPQRDYYGNRGGSPSRSPPRKRFRGRYDRSPDRSPPRGRYREYRDYRDDYGPPRDRYRGRRERSPSPERLRRQEREDKDRRYGVIREERGIRTIFVQNLPADITELQVEDWFEARDCEVRDVQLVFDKQRKFKGLAYVELYKKEKVAVGLSLNNEMFHGRPIFVEAANAPKTTAGPAYVSTEGTTAPYHGAEPLLRLYLGNLDYGITQEDLMALLQPFGPLESVRLQSELSGKSKGHAFIQFYRKEHALAAFHKLNATHLAGRQLRCDFTKDARSRDPDLPPSPPMISSARTVYFPESGSAVRHDLPQGTMAPRATHSEMGSLEDEMSGSATSMHSLIQRLAASTSASSSASITSANVTANPIQPQQPIASQSLLPIVDKANLPHPGEPTNCFVLKNVFDPSTETSPQFDKEIEEDIAPEASKFGTLNHIFVDKHSFGDVYLRFDEVQAAEKAVADLHGRYFAFRLIRAEYLSPAVYAKKCSL